VTYDPWAVAGGISSLLIARLQLPKGRSWWLPAEDAIVLDSRLDQAGRRSALAHELIHRERQDTACLCDVTHAKQESRVCSEAARRLISVEALADALLWSGDDYEIAEELWVDLETVRTRINDLTDPEKEDIYQRLWARDEGAA